MCGLPGHTYDEPSFILCKTGCDILLIVEVFIHNTSSIPVLFDKEPTMPCVHHLVGSLKVSVAGLVKAHYTASLLFDLARQ
jgi:hypothetical protein